VTVTAYDSANAAVPQARRFTELTGPGTFNAPANCGGPGRATPVACTTQAGGVVAGNFGTPTPLPDGGTATLECATTTPAARRNRTYTYTGFPGSPSSNVCPDGKQSQEASLRHRMNSLQPARCSTAEVRHLHLAAGLGFRV